MIRWILIALTVVCMATVLTFGQVRQAPNAKIVKFGNVPENVSLSIEVVGDTLYVSLELNEPQLSVSDSLDFSLERMQWHEISDTCLDTLGWAW